MSDITLKPCPFCGALVSEVLDQNEINGVDDDEKVEEPYYAVLCQMWGEDLNVRIGCGSISGYWKTPEEAALAWNRRM